MKNLWKRKGMQITISVFLMFIFVIGILILLDTKAARKETAKNTKEATRVTTDLLRDTESSEMEDTSEKAKEMVSRVTIGWNLGNALDSYTLKNVDWQSKGLPKETYFETLMGNPATTKEMIDKIAGAGYSAVRVPVTYINHMDSAGNIDQAWLARIAEIVSLIQEDGMYCIIDVHHDAGKDGWLTADQTALNDNQKRFQTMWTQIAQYFQSYNNTLIFEGYNEILDEAKNWSNPTADDLAAANQLNQSFVDAVRKTGGNNATRNLIVNTYAAKAESYILKGFAIPTDTVKNHLTVGVHIYDTDAEKQKQMLQMLNDYFVSRQVPVLIGEYGTSFKTDSASRIKNVQNLILNAKQYHIPVFWWDDGNYKQQTGAQCDYALLDRVSLNWYDEQLVTAMVAASKQ